ncbi:hypothetical protein ACFLYB_02760 [Chloroflexota bacterium]
MAIGRLFSYDEEFNVEIDFRLHDNSEQGWWGELTLTEYRRLKDGDGYLIILDDGRKGRCLLRKRVNKAVRGLLPLYCYHFRGNGPLEE